MCSVLAVSVSGLCYLNVCLVLLTIYSTKRHWLHYPHSTTVVTSSNMHISAFLAIREIFSLMKLAGIVRCVSQKHFILHAAIQFKQNTETRLPY